MLQDILPRLVDELSQLSQNEFLLQMPFLHDYVVTIQDYLEIVRE